MPVCEKCWGDAYLRMIGSGRGISQYDHYLELLKERKENPCTPEQQSGEDRPNPANEEESK